MKEVGLARGGAASRTRVPGRDALRQHSDRSPLDGQKARIAPAIEQGLEGRVAGGIEGRPAAHPILTGMRRVEARAGHEAGRDRRRRHVGAAGTQNRRKDERARPRRSRLTGTGDRRIDFDAPQTRSEDAVRAHRREVQADRIVAREEWPPGAGAQTGEDLPIAHPNAGIDRPQAQPEIEQDRRAILLPRGVPVWPEFGHLGTPGHGAIGLGQAQRHGVVVAAGKARLVGDRPEARSKREGERTAIRGQPDPLVRQGARRLVGIAHEFGQGTEAAEAPSGVGVGQRAAQERFDL